MLRAASLILASAAFAPLTIHAQKDDPKVKPLPPANAVPKWIWLGKEAKPGQTLWFRKEIRPRGRSGGARLFATCDDSMTIYLNGKQIGSGDAWQKPVFIDLTDKLQQGANILAIEAHNDKSTAGALLARVLLESPEKGFYAYVTDGSWRVSDKQVKDWQNADFDDSAWSQATVIAKLGDAPWTVVNEATLAAAAKPQKAVAALESRLKVLKDFKAEIIYNVPRDTQGSWVSMTVDPKGRLIVSDQYGKLFRVVLPSLAGDQKLRVEPINVDIGEAQGLLWAFDSLYVMVNRGSKYVSGLYRVLDTDGDDQLDTVKQLRSLPGYGEHGPHAILLSPDGKSLHVLAGNHTDLTNFDKFIVTKAWDEDTLLPRIWDPRGHAVGRMAPGGWIARVDPEGKSWDLVSAGYRNQYDAAFNRDGELFTYDSDMEWDMSTPWYRPTRICHATSGSEFGWRSGTALFPTYYPDNLPTVVDLGQGSPTGVTFGYGARFPAKYQDALFVCDWSYGKLYAIHMTPHGSTYRGQAEEFITGTPLPLTDIVVNPHDGAMYFAVGGRKAMSALYRVTYTGTESTAAAPVNTDGADARNLRRKLEAYHGRKDAAAIDVAWPFLGHSDRFIRWAARTIIEQQDVKDWQQRALAEKDKRAALEALVALVRVGDKSLQPKLIERLDAFAWNDLDYSEKLELLRIYDLCFMRMATPDATTTARTIERFDPHYPAKGRELNTELCKMLVYLQAPSAAAKTMPLMTKALTQEEQMEYALSLRNLKTGWTLPLREEFFSWFLKANNYKGGASFQGFVQRFKTDAIATLSAEEKTKLQTVLTATASPKVTAPQKPRPLVKNWTVEELTPIVEQGLRNRDFDNGRAMFAAANCFACHRFSSEGGATGPDLTAVAGRFNVRDLLEATIVPSKVISDQYEAVLIEMDDGRFVSGRIVNLAGDVMMINTDMYDPDKQTKVDRRLIADMRPSPVSMMPANLLDTLNRDEILDLMAYLLSRGDRSNAMFRKE